MRKYDDLYKKGAPPSQSFTRQSSLQKSPKEYIDYKLIEDKSREEMRSFPSRILTVPLHGTCIYT